MAADVRRRVPHVDDVAVTGDVALIRGSSALRLARLLAEELTGGLEATLVRRGVGPEARARVLRAYHALEQAGGAWLEERNAAAAGGNAATGGNELDLPSEEWMGTNKTALRLGVSPRRVRQLAATGELPGLNDRGRLRFRRADVDAIRDRRRAA
jgi:excisionase family DNA binding protein